MIPEIATINSHICDFEKQFNVTFSRENASICSYNGKIILHLYAYEWTNFTVDTDKRIVSLIAVIDPVALICGIAIVVLVNSGSAFTGYEIWDINSGVIDSGDVSTGGIKYGGGPQNCNDPDTQLLGGFLKTTLHDVTITINIPSPHPIHVHGTLDVSIFWGLIDIDICEFDADITSIQINP